MMSRVCVCLCVPVSEMKAFRCIVSSWQVLDKSSKDWKHNKHTVKTRQLINSNKKIG